MPRPYNTTELAPFTAIERQVVHRDMLAHIWRWSFALRRGRMGDTWTDFGCGSAGLLETAYRNKYRPTWYLGFDIREKTMASNREKFSEIKFPAYFVAADLTSPDFGSEVLDALDPPLDYPKHAVSFEVVEHVGKQNVQQFLENFRRCGGPETTYYLSTPNHDPKVGAAGNHTYDSGDGRGVAVQEWDYDELNSEIIGAGFEIVEEFGTFASKKDYWPHISDADKELYARLSKYYDSNVVSNFMAPLVPARYARNAMRIMRSTA